jgi:phage baseplate assembly protein W
MTNITKIYSDIDFTFTKRPVVNDVALSYDAQAVIRSIRNLLLTKHYEKPFNPDLGSNLDALLFENFSPLTSSSIEREILNMVTNYEPRARMQYINVSVDDSKNAYNVTLSFFIENATTPTTVTLFLERNR